AHRDDGRVQFRGGHDLQRTRGGRGGVGGGSGRGGRDRRGRGVPRRLDRLGPLGHRNLGQATEVLGLGVARRAGVERGHHRLEAAGGRCLGGLRGGSGCRGGRHRGGRHLRRDRGRGRRGRGRGVGACSTDGRRGGRGGRGRGAGGQLGQGRAARAGRAGRA